MEGISASLPANYVSLKVLQDRWLKRKQEEEIAETLRHEEENKPREEKEPKIYHLGSQFQTKSLSPASDPSSPSHRREKKVSNLSNRFHGRESKVVGLNNGYESIRSDLVPEVIRRRKPRKRRSSRYQKVRGLESAVEIGDERTEEQGKGLDTAKKDRMNEICRVVTNPSVEIRIELVKKQENGLETMNRDPSDEIRTERAKKQGKGLVMKKRDQTNEIYRVMINPSADIKNKTEKQWKDVEMANDEICRLVTNPSVNIRKERKKKQGKGLQTANGDQTDEIYRLVPNSSAKIRNERAMKQGKGLMVENGDRTEEICRRMTNLTLAGGAFRHGGNFGDRRSSMMWVRKSACG